MDDSGPDYFATPSDAEAARLLGRTDALKEIHAFATSICVTDEQMANTGTASASAELVGRQRAMVEILAYIEQASEENLIEFTLRIRQLSLT